jgi:uncharacterized iron-regulated protein
MRGRVVRWWVAAVVLGVGDVVLAGQPLDPTPSALATAMAGKRIVLLGEVHDNRVQHALRVAALRLVVQQGARPAIAYEQFDREAQAAIDRSRRERPGDAAYLIAQAKGAPSWNWSLYQPYVELALAFDLPIVAANLSRDDAMKVATTTGASDAGPVPPAFLAAHEAEIARGHCDLLPADALPAMANAQIARDRTLAGAIRPYAARGVVLLTGNGHARVDIGVPHWLAPDERRDAVSIGVLERDDGGGADETEPFDAYVLTERAERPDPCDDLRRRLGGKPSTDAAPARRSAMPGR